MFTKVEISMRDKSSSGKEEFIKLIIIVNVDQIMTVFPYDNGNTCSIMMINGDRLHATIPFEEFSQRLLELRKLTLDS